MQNYLAKIADLQDKNPKYKRKNSNINSGYHTRSPEFILFIIKG